MVIHAVQMLYVEHMIIKRFVRVCQITLADRQIADQNVLWMKIAQQRWLASVINVKIHAKELVGQMLTAPFSITERIVFVTSVSPAIHLPAVVK